MQWHGRSNMEGTSLQNNKRRTLNFTIHIFAGQMEDLVSFQRHDLFPVVSSQG
jgi:hypothetical protein